MKYHIIAVGRTRRGPEATLYNHYIARLRVPLRLHEVEEKKRLCDDERKERETNLLLNAVPKGAVIVALDEGGKAMSSLDLAEKIGTWQNQARSEIAFLIGGANGLGSRARRQAELCLNFGRLTWPHMLVRAMLAEQIYRIQQIQAGHPYHRA